MNEIQVIRKNSNKRLGRQIATDMKKVRQFYMDYPYCAVCECRALKDHKEHIFTPLILA